MYRDRLIAELREEGAMTKKVLERVPAAKLSWKPHERSMSLGQLAMHIAGLPHGIAELLNERVREIPVVPLPEARGVEEIIAALDESLSIAEAKLAAWGDEGLMERWKLTKDGIPLFEVPRIEMVRTLMLNHWYHHRGQLTIYLRMLDVPLPALYGPTADES